MDLTSFPSSTQRKINPAGDGSGCWNWNGFRFQGYGCVTLNGRKTYTHRALYELAHGPIPDGLVIDHICLNKACCNPAHLRAITTEENGRRGGLTRRPAH